MAFDLVGLKVYSLAEMRVVSLEIEKVSLMVETKVHRSVVLKVFLMVLKSVV
jgi:hypothetical protein